MNGRFVIPLVVLLTIKLIGTSVFLLCCEYPHYMNSLFVSFRFFSFLGPSTHLVMFQFLNNHMFPICITCLHFPMALLSRMSTGYPYLWLLAPFQHKLESALTLVHPCIFFSLVHQPQLVCQRFYIYQCLHVCISQPEAVILENALKRPWGIWKHSGKPRLLTPQYMATVHFLQHLLVCAIDMSHPPELYVCEWPAHAESHPAQMLWNMCVEHKLQGKRRSLLGSPPPPPPAISTHFP